MVEIPFLLYFDLLHRPKFRSHGSISLYLFLTSIGVYILKQLNIIKVCEKDSVSSWNYYLVSNVSKDDSRTDELLNTL